MIMDEGRVAELGRTHFEVRTLCDDDHVRQAVTTPVDLMVALGPDDIDDSAFVECRAD